MDKRRTMLRTAATGVTLTAAGIATTYLPGADAGLWGAGELAAGVALTAGSVTWYVRARQSTGEAIARWARRTRRTGGTATYVDHLRRTSSWQLRRRATRLRPSLAALPQRERRRVPLTEIGVRLGRSGGRTLWLDWERNVLRVAAPRSGKSSALVERILTAPGGVVVTSTRVDLMHYTGALRAARGPIHTYDPGGVSGQGSSIKWSPATGCQDPAIALRRAQELVPRSTNEEAERWDAQARRILGVLLHAAALADAPMRVVARWLTAEGEALERIGPIVSRALSASSMAAQMTHAVEQHWSLNDRTRSSINASASAALAWLTDPEASAIADIPPSASTDLGQLLDHRATLYILGRESGITGPLTGALVGEVMRIASVAAERRGGRLDPPMTMVLDEAATVVPAPLHHWTADCGGRGIVLDIAVQSLAALRLVWGAHAAAMLMTNCNAIMVGGGCNDPGDLDHWESLTGTREVPVETRDAEGKVTSRSTRTVPVIPRDQIYALPVGQVIVYGLGPATIARTPDGMGRRDAKAAKRAAERSAPHATAYEQQARAEAAADGAGETA